MLMTVRYKIYDKILDGVIENINGPIVDKIHARSDNYVWHSVADLICNPVWLSVDISIASSLENKI